MILLCCITAFILTSSVAAYEEVCYDDLGCFTNEPPWGSTPQRPLAVLPDDPSKVNTRLYLDTRYQADVEVYYNDMNGLGSTFFNKDRTTRFIIHGFLDNGDLQWLSDMSNAFLAKENENIIRVGWMGGSLQANYASSAVDTQIVGATLAKMIENMINVFGMKASQFHCIGHSLGAQTCGYVGEKTPGLGRITGLDPAGPYFEYTHVDVRLDDSDAIFVDVIHSDAVTLEEVGFGTAEKSGDVDFWPNGGFEQPGCDQNMLSTIIGVNGIVDGTRDFVACNHIRAVKFFTESITTSCPYKTYPCLSYSEFLNGKCLDCDGTGCPQLGYHADAYSYSNMKMFSTTNALAPFCQYMTDVGIELGSNTKTIDGSLYLTLYGPNGATEQQRLGGEDMVYRLRPGGYHSALVHYDSDPGDIEYVKILWVQEEFDIGREYISVKYISVFFGKEQHQYVFCGDTSIRMDEKTRYTLYPGQSCM